MSNQQISGPLVNPGDAVGNLRVGGGSSWGDPLPSKVTISATGVCVGAWISIQAVPISQPLQLTSAVGFPPTFAPVSAASWFCAISMNQATGYVAALTRIGPLTSTGAAGTGFSWTIDTSTIVLLRIVLLQANSSNLLATLATCLPSPRQSFGVSSMPTR
jgi:hypothetical protein